VLEWASATLDGKKLGLQHILTIMPVMIETDARRVSSFFLHNTHAAPTQLLDDPVVRDGLADHAQECYCGLAGKSMKAVELVDTRWGCWRKIAIMTGLITRGEGKLPCSMVAT
jgi:hypothetical protein